MRRIPLIALIVVVVAAAGGLAWLLRTTPAPPPVAGVAEDLAEWRASVLSDVRYDVAFALPSSRTAAITGRLTASFALASAARALPLDFAQSESHVLSVRVNGRAIHAAVVHGHVILPANALAAGANTVEVDFIAGDESLNRNDDYLYTLFVPARASLAMPCFDQPDLKARWTLRLETPLDWTAVSNTRVSGRAVHADRASLTFDETQPLPTYLFAFVAGKFQVETAERNGRTMHILHRETDAAKVAANREAIFDLHAKAIAWLEDYTGIKYPFSKLDCVLIPAFQFGGMEHPGAIYYNASSMMLDASATENQRLGRASTISHETSHMWFGDLVTMKWFNDVWMKEVFANFMAAKIVNPSFPAVNHDLRFLLENYPTAYDVDRTDGANPIRQDLGNLSEAGTLYGAIIYQKAPIVMRQLELLVGADVFRTGLRDYLTRYSFGNATWNDLIDALGRAVKAAHGPSQGPVPDLAAWSHAWVEEPGRPTIATALALGNGTIASLAFDERDPRVRGLVWPERLQVLVGLPSGVRRVDVTITGAHTVVPEVAGWPAPLWVLPVGGGLGYGFFDLDPTTLAFLTTSLHTITDPLTRGAAAIALWESMLEGRTTPSAVWHELMVALPVETVDLNVSHLLGLARTIFWRFTPDTERAAEAPAFERLLRGGLTQAASTSLKATWFSAVRGTALTPETVGWLERVWRRDETIKGLPLSDNDEADLAIELAIRNVADAPVVLQAELARLTNPDRHARFEFLLRALSNDQATRDAFFDGLTNVANRRHEAWVLDAMRALNHPLRADASRKYLIPALGLVREIQQTGDIFFPKRWADAALGGDRSPGAATAVRGFIDGLPADYPVRLKWVLLSAADPLFRAARAADAK
jgi:aminopeptidase N